MGGRLWSQGACPSWAHGSALSVVAHGEYCHAGRQLRQTPAGFRGEGVSPATIIPLMRTVFVCDDSAEIAALKDRLSQEVDNTRLVPGETVDDWTLIETEFL